MLVRTRFAPSPTGTLHVGGVRTALFSWLFSKHLSGQFYLRIEDTDKSRSTKESVQAILDGMKWLGLESKNEIVFQSSRFSRYASIAEKLLSEGKAYRCTCTQERLETLRDNQLKAHEKPRYDGHCRDKNLMAGSEPFVIRFKNPEHGVVSFQDQVYGEIHVHNQELDDLVLVRSDGIPTYNFAVVIDDWDMEITHVIRGDDHINNTPRQINLYHALNAPLPVFAHLPMILGEDGKRLSKRHGAVSVMEFKRMGILPEALLNYLVRLGWSHGDQEIFTVNEMIDFFDLRHVHRGVASFNYDKLFWLNHHYIKTSAPADIAEQLAWHFAEREINLSHGPSLEAIVTVQADRCKTLEEMCERSLYFYVDEIEYDEEAMKKHLRPIVLEPLEALYHQFEKLENWKAGDLNQCIQSVCDELTLNLGKVAQPLRVAVTGNSMSPSMDITLELLGKKRTLERLQFGLDYVRKRMEQSQ